MDSVFEAEQEHVSDVYQQLVDIERALSDKIKADLQTALEDKESMLDELALNADADVHVETMAEYEAMNRIIDAYNLTASIDAERLHRAQLLKRQPYFAKVQLQFDKGGEKDVYIGAAGMTDEMHRHIVVDWRSPVAEVYYNQGSGRTSYEAAGRTIECDLKLRRQFDIDHDVLNAYFDTTVAIQDPLLLASLSKERTDKLQAITTTIQKEQNTVIRHEDVDALLVGGIAGSGKTSVLLQRIAYLFYRERDKLDPSDVYLITPNEVFQRYIDNVLPEMGESNPVTLTWASLMESLGLGSRGIGDDATVESLRLIDEKLPSFELDGWDFQDIRVENERVIGSAQARGAYGKLSRFPCGTHRCSLTADDLHERLQQRIKRLSANEDYQDVLRDLGDEEQIRIFGRYVDMADESEVVDMTRLYLEDRYASVEELIDDAAWLRIDRIGMRLLGKDTLTAIEWLYLKLALAGGAKRSARYVMIDEVQDYTEAQLMVLAKYFPNARFLLLGDENQAIRHGTASFEQIRELFSRLGREVAECSLMTSYRSSPEITELFCRLLPATQRVQADSVQREGTRPNIQVLPSAGKLLDALDAAVEDAESRQGLTAIIAPDAKRAKQLAKRLKDRVVVAEAMSALPESGVLLLDVKSAKGLEFDRVIVTDADDTHYPDEPIARHRLYTAISRATQEVTLFACKSLATMLR